MTDAWETNFTGQLAKSLATLPWVIFWFTDLDFIANNIKSLTLTPLTRTKLDSDQPVRFLSLSSDVGVYYDSKSDHDSNIKIDYDSYPEFDYSDAYH
ncbi:hypothetical protein ABZP36_011988 [Zizania latifolia]